MKPRLAEALKNMKRHNAGVMSRECFGFEPEIPYDALVVVTGWKPDKIILDPSFTVTQLTQHAYFSGFLVERDGLRIAWAQTASGACNVLDHVSICAELTFQRMIFAGAVGGLTADFPVGQLCTPEVCLQGSYAGAYLEQKLPAFTPYRPVYPPDRAYVDRVVDLGQRLGQRHDLQHLRRPAARRLPPADTARNADKAPPCRQPYRPCWWQSQPASLHRRVCSQWLSRLLRHRNSLPHAPA